MPAAIYASEILLQLINGKNTELSYLMYECLLELDTPGIYSSAWIAYVTSICIDCGKSAAWLTQSGNNPNSFKKAIEIRLKKNNESPHGTRL